MNTRLIFCPNKLQNFGLEFCLQDISPKQVCKYKLISLNNSETKVHGGEKEPNVTIIYILANVVVCYCYIGLLILLRSAGVLCSLYFKTSLYMHFIRQVHTLSLLA